MSIKEYIRSGKVALHIIRKDGTKIDYTGQLLSVTWSGDEGTDCRQIEVSMINSVSTVRKRKHQPYSYGDLAILFYDNKEIFRGIIFTLTMNSNGIEDFVAYDSLIYLAKSSDTVFYKNTSVNDIIKKQCKAAGIDTIITASIPNKMPKLLAEGMTRSEIIKKALDWARTKNSASYKIRDIKGKAELISRKTASKTTIKITDVISASNRYSIEDIVTQVLVTKGSFDDKDNKFVSVKKTDNEQAKLYGNIQHVITVDDKLKSGEMKAQADVYLRQNNQPVSEVNIEFVGHVDCITGNKIEVQDDLTKIKSEYYISADTHTFADGLHTMSLQLSTKLT